VYPGVKLVAPIIPKVLYLSKRVLEVIELAWKELAYAAALRIPRPCGAASEAAFIT
jgi:hypothetical protein